MRRILIYGVKLGFKDKAHWLSTRPNLPEMKVSHYCLK